ncbi:MAG: hypothetical protein K6F39_09445 [Lachnospiraceae bacterium]|nr:hypothetical protein [Lachnospiraceae bacterium]
MIKRKLLTVALAAVLALGTVGCGSSSQAAEDSESGEVKSLFEHSSSKDDDDDDRKDDDEDEEDEKDDEDSEKKDDEDEDDSDKKDDDKDSEEKDEEDEEDDDDEVSGLSEKEIIKKLGDDVESGEFAVDDAIYELPAKVSDFEKHGWELDKENSDEYIDGERYANVILKKGEKYLHLGTENYDDYTISYKDATVTSVGVDKSFDTVMYLPAGIDSTMDMDEVKDALEDNNVDYKDEVDDVTSYFEDYLIDTKDYHVVIDFVKDDKSLLSIQVSKDIDDTSDYEGAPEAEVETADTEDLDIDYTRPKKISELTDFDLDGDLYSIGAPVSEFLDNGWEIDEDSLSDKQVEGNSTGQATLIKDDMSLLLSVENNNSETVDIKDAVLTSIIVRDAVNSEVWGNIKAGDSTDEVKEALEDAGMEYEESDNYISYSDDRVYVCLTLRDDKVTCFRVEKM